MTCADRLRVLAAVLATALVLGLPGAAAPARAQTAPPPGLGGETFFSQVPDAAGACDQFFPSTFNFAAQGVAADPYPGTFEETGQATVGPLASSTQPLLALTADFTITTTTGATVVGTKWLESGTSTGRGTCRSTFGLGDRYDIFAENLRYTATITTADGRTCTAVGSASLTLIRDSDADVGHFNESFLNDVANPIPTCDDGGEEPPPPAAPAAKDDCKVGGYEAYGFRNQGECVKFVNRRDKGE